MSFIALGWSVLAVVALAYFVRVLAPALGDAMNIHMSSRRGSFDLSFVTRVLADVSIWIAAAVGASALVSLTVGGLSFTFGPQ